jgi:spore coat protein H
MRFASPMAVLRTASVCPAAVIFLGLFACGSGSPDNQGPDGGGISDADTDAQPPESPVSGEVVFDDSQLRTYELTVAAKDFEWLNANAQLEQYVPATLMIEGQTYGPIGLRYKGDFGTLFSCFDAVDRNLCHKLSIKLKFNEYEKGLRIDGLKRLNFHSNRSDPSLLRERLAYSLFRDAGVIAPRAVHGLLRINGEDMGIFTVVEQIDSRFARNRFIDIDGGDGNVYKEAWPAHVDQQRYLGALRTNEKVAPDVSRMVRFATEITEAANDAAIARAVQLWTDIDALLAYFAVDRVIDNWDGIVTWYCFDHWCNNHNYYWYEQTDRDRLWLIPWDLDNTFQVPNPILSSSRMPQWDEWPVSCAEIAIFNDRDVHGRPAACDGIIRSVATRLSRGVKAATEAFLSGPFAAAPVQEKLDRWQAQIASAVAADQKGPGMVQWMAELTKLQQNITTLRDNANTAMQAP